MNISKASGGDIQNATTIEAIGASLWTSEGYLGDTLRSLIQTVSVNPGTTEEEMARAVVRHLTGSGATTTFVEAVPNRPCVAAVIEGESPGPTLVLNGHMDTVPIDDPAAWSADPFGGEVIDGNMYGRGAADMKSGLTAMIATAQYVGQMAANISGRLILQFAVDEEAAGPGTLALLQKGFTGDYGVVTEPTKLRVATAERGLAWFRVSLKGRSIHAGVARQGVNPITKAARVIDALVGYDRDLSGRCHVFLPPPSCTATMISAGIKENMVADSCDIVLDRRILPEETKESAEAELRALFDRVAEEDADFQYRLELMTLYEPTEVSEDCEIATLLCRNVELVTGHPGELWGTPYSSDVRNLVNDAGIQAITFGPGDIGNAHAVDEHVSLREVRSAAMILTKTALDLLTRGE